MSRSCLLLLLLTIVAGCSGCPGAGRTDTPPGERTLITGTVKDGHGSAIPGATVTASKKGSEFASSATTDSAGEYIIDKLRTGSYLVRASSNGYSVSTKAVELSNAGDQARIDFTLDKESNR